MSRHDTAFRMQLYEKIGQRVRAERFARNLTAKQVGDKLGLSEASVIRVEMGDGAPVHFLASFAQLVGCTVESLIPHVPFGPFGRVKGEPDA